MFNPPDGRLFNPPDVQIIQINPGSVSMTLLVECSLRTLSDQTQSLITPKLLITRLSPV